MTVDEIRDTHLKLKAKEELVRNLLKIGVEIEKIMEASGFTKEELDEIISDIDNK